MAYMLTLWSTLLCLFACSVFVNALNNTNSTGTHVVTAVSLDNAASFGVCVYPTSGTYSFLVRLLYYCTLVFSLFSRAHLWLVAGALVSALVYSGSAAVHACLLVWRGPNPYIENDSWALYAILNSACLVTVPLLNWSGTLRRLGQKVASAKDPKALKTNSDVGTRTIVIYWAFLVLIGYICTWQQAHYGAADKGSEYPDLSKVICGPGTNASMLLSSNGTFYQRPIDLQFIQDNGCTDPCNQITGLPSIFRSQNELVLLPHSQALIWNQEIPGPKYARTAKILDLASKNLSINFWTLPFVIVQGFITVFFGRRDPREIRDLIYMTLSMDHPISSRRYIVSTQEILVRMFAGLNYLIACAVVIFCVPYFIISVIAQEFQIWDEEPDAEKPYMIGQWTPWASAALIILAALIARYHDDAVSLVAQGFRRISHVLKSHFSRTHAQRHPEPEHGLPSTAPEKSWPYNSSSSRTKSSSPSTSTNEIPPPSPRAPTPKPTTGGLLTAATHIYKSSCGPLNQTGKGPIDELRNFVHWCRDPQLVSRMVVRHPIRHHDVNYLDTTAASSAAVVVTDAREQDHRSSFFRGAQVERRSED